MNAIILAGGMGSRLGGKSEAKPKGFLNVDGCVLIHRSIELLKAGGVNQIYIGTGFGAEHYEKLAREVKGITCFHNADFAITGSLETFCLVSIAAKSDCLLLESDIVYEKRALQAVMNHPGKNVIVVGGATRSGDEVYIETNEKGFLKNLSKDTKLAATAVGELVGISRLSIALIRDIQRWAKRPSTLHYEEALVALSHSHKIVVEKISYLVWGEIDTEQHYQRVKNGVLPKIRDLENVPKK